MFSLKSSVFISFAKEDRDRVEPLARYLTDKGFAIWLDREDFEYGTPLRNAIEDAFYQAACVVVVWTANSVRSSYVHARVSSAQQRGLLVPILLDSAAEIPDDLTQVQYEDLVGWNGMESPALRQITTRIRSLIERPEHLPTLSDNNGAIQETQQAVSGLHSLTSSISSIREILISESAPAKDLRGALEEVAKTYRVANSAIERFIIAGLQGGSIDPGPYVTLERGTLVTDIRNGRGHCDRILTYYFRYGGLRNWIETKVSSEQLQQVDQAFADLGTADGDLFIPLARIGDILTGESEAIVNMLFQGEERAVRQRVKEGRTTLKPLEEQLSNAMRELQELQGSLGHAEPL
jgi:hypothetical protein